MSTLKPYQVPDIAQYERVEGEVVISIPPTRGLQLCTYTLMALVLVLPLMMGQRTPETLTLSHLVMLSLTGLAVVFAWASQELPAPRQIWWFWFGALSLYVGLQVLPIPVLAQWFGPYPEALWQQPDFAPSTWSPDVGASLRAWAVLLCLTSLAYLTSYLPRSCRMQIWVAVVVSALFQAFYGLIAHAGGSETVLGIWPRNNVDFVHGSFSNRNLFSAYLALLWPLAVGIWFIRRVPGLKHLPQELKIAGSLFCGGLLGAALLGSASRLGSAAGVLGIALTLMLWQVHRKNMPAQRQWPVWLAAAAAMLAASWYGIMPLAERLVATTAEEGRLIVWGQMFSQAPIAWWFHGVGLAGFESAFKSLQPGDVRGWYDYAHNDLLQWVFEMGVVGVLAIVAIGQRLVRRWRLDTERACLYAGLAAIGVVSLGDFSGHIPATQVVVALIVGALIKQPHARH
jgi:putative inorganic carbon (HCO3(-)) transporter